MINIDSKTIDMEIDNEDFDNSMSEIELDETKDEIIEIEDDIDVIEDIDLIDDIIDDLVIEEISEISDISDIDEDVSISKHTQEGKHSLKYDTIFKGRKEDPLTEDDLDFGYHVDRIEIEKGTDQWSESMDNENYVRSRIVKEKVYSLLKDKTNLNFLNNRRKPSKIDFNKYFQILNLGLKSEGFSSIEIFNELSVYFSDNLFNMFKLLNNKWRNIIISELQIHIGKQTYSKELSIKNLHIGTEVEFIWDDNIEIKLITGIVINITDNIIMIDSFEKIYNLEFFQIKQILNNNKSKYNLNKLNSIDFL